MKCQKCGADVENGEKFCQNCGTEIKPLVNMCENEVIQHRYKDKNSSKTFKMAIILRIVVGLMFIGASFYTNYQYGDWFKNGLSTGNSVLYSAYGGDAYTGIQNAAAQTATNVKILSEITLYGLKLTANNIGWFSWNFLQVVDLVLILVGVSIISSAILEYGKYRYNELTKG